MGDRALKIRAGAERRAFQEMASGGLLYVYTGEHGPYCPPPWPVEGSGAIVFEGPPRHVGRRIVSRLLRAGADWCPRRCAHAFTPKAQREVLAILAGRDILWIASPLQEGDAQEGPAR